MYIVHIMYSSEKKVYFVIQATKECSMFKKSGPILIVYSHYTNIQDFFDTQYFQQVNYTFIPFIHERISKQYLKVLREGGKQFSFFHMGIHNKKFWLVKNVQVWVAKRYFELSAKTTAGGGGGGVQHLMVKVMSMLLKFSLTVISQRDFVDGTVVESCCWRRKAVV